MAKVNICNVEVLENPASFFDPFKFKITFECHEPLDDDLEWRLVYVSSAYNSSLDQTLDSILVGPVPVGRHQFSFEASAPDPKLIPAEDIVGVTVVLIQALYRDKEFIRLERQIIASDPRVTRFPIDWGDGLLDGCREPEQPAEDNEESTSQDNEESVSQSNEEFVQQVNEGSGTEDNEMSFLQDNEESVQQINEGSGTEDNEVFLLHDDESAQQPNEGSSTEDSEIFALQDNEESVQQPNEGSSTEDDEMSFLQDNEESVQHVNVGSVLQDNEEQVENISQIGQLNESRNDKLGSSSLGEGQTGVHFTENTSCIPLHVVQSSVIYFDKF
ncbi:unnamed protein product [Trichobilharzia regenti]|nr:unnamed protein product [Trichobilharzia regenti]